MTEQHFILHRQQSLSALLCAPALLVLGGTAHAETRVTVPVSAGISVSNNPYLEVGAGSTAFGATIEASPTVVFEEASTTVVLQGNVRNTQYFSRYGSDLGASVGVVVSHKASASTTLRASTGYHTSKSGLRDRLYNQTNPIAGLTPVDLFIPDSTLIGQRERSHSFYGSVGATFTPSARDTFTLDGGFNRFWSRSALARDYNNYSLRAGYSRAFTDRTSGWVSLSGSKSDYSGTRRGDGTVFTPMAGFQHKINDRLTLSAGAGASIANTDDGTGVKRRSTGLAVDASLCQRDTRGSYCLAAQRMAQPTAFGGVQNVLNIGFNMSRRLSDKNDISLSSGYTRNDGSNVPGVGIAADYLTLGGSFGHRFNERLSAFVAPHYDKTLRSAVNRRSDYGVTAGIRYVFGVVQ